MSIYNYWGKAQGEGWHLLPYHSIDVAACSIELLRSRPGWNQSLSELLGIDGDEIVALVGFFASVHDLGKFSDAFQGLVPEIREQLGHSGQPPAYDSKARHDSLGWTLWFDRIRTSKNWGKSVDTWMRCAYGHHGQPPSRVRRSKKYITDNNVADATRWVDIAFDVFHPDFDRMSLDKCKVTSWWIAGLITIADWLGSNTNWFQYVESEMPIDEYLEVASEKAKVAVIESGLGRSARQLRTFAELFPMYTPSPLQEEVGRIATEEANFLVVEDMTGSGKTEAALVASSDSFYFGLPTQATANGLWLRVSENKVLEGSRSLLHSSRWLVPKAMSQATAWLNDSNRQSMLSQIGVGTIDQAELAVLYSKFSSLRLIALADKTLIVDEVHAYGKYQREILATLISFQATVGASVILLSATLPMSERQYYVDAWLSGRNLEPRKINSSKFPLLTQIRGGELTEIPVQSNATRVVRFQFESSEGKIVSLIERAIAQNECVCWIRNTVDEAVSAYEMLSAAFDDVELFHARFTVGDRAVIESRITECFGKGSQQETRAGKILIATQVVEQSLDIDFDLLITDLCPMDLLLQRSGRQHRHDRGERGIPTTVVHAPAFSSDPTSTWVTDWSSGTGAVYADHGKLWLTVHTLQTRKTIQLPRDAREMIESVYGDGTEEEVPDSLAIASNKAEQDSIKAMAIGDINSISLNKFYETDTNLRWDEEQAPTRLGERSREWLLFEGEKPISGSAPASTIKIPAWRLKKQNIKIPGVTIKPWQAALVMNRQGGQLSALGEGPNGQAVEISYDSDIGLSFS